MLCLCAIKFCFYTPPNSISKHYYADYKITEYIGSINFPCKIIHRPTSVVCITSKIIEICAGEVLSDYEYKVFPLKSD